MQITSVRWCISMCRWFFAVASRLRRRGWITPLLRRLCWCRDYDIRRWCADDITKDGWWWDDADITSHIDDADALRIRLMLTLMPIADDWCTSFRLHWYASIWCAEGKIDEVNIDETLLIDDYFYDTFASLFSMITPITPSHLWHYWCAVSFHYFCIIDGRGLSFDVRIWLWWCWLMKYFDWLMLLFFFVAVAKHFRCIFGDIDGWLHPTRRRLRCGSDWCIDDASYADDVREILMTLRAAADELCRLRWCAMM